MVSLSDKFKSFAERSEGVRNGKVLTPEIEKKIYDELERRRIEYKKEQAEARRLYGHIIKG